MLFIKGVTMKRLLFLIAAATLIALNSNSQQPAGTDTTVLNAMNRIKILEGSWAGKGWIQMGRERKNFIQTEAVVGKANGTVYVIDGLGVDEANQKPVHQAFAVISYDLNAKKYLIRAFLANGNYIDGNIKVDADGKIIWGYRHPQAGEIRYTITAFGGTWNEKGEMNRDGSAWIPIFEMNLTRK
jgi:hypothetical protein